MFLSIDGLSLIIMLSLWLHGYGLISRNMPETRRQNLFNKKFGSIENYYFFHIFNGLPLKGS